MSGSLNHILKNQINFTPKAIVFVSLKSKAEIAAALVKLNVENLEKMVICAEFNVIN